MKIKTAFDLDGVVYDLVKQFDNYMTKEGFDIADKTSFKLGKRYGIPRVDGELRMDKFGTTRPFRTTPIYENAKQEIIKTAERNEVYIVTYRNWSPFGVEDTLERIKKDLPVKHENIIFSKNKGKWANKLGIDIFYEDNLENTFDIINKSKSLVALVDTTYNQLDPNINPRQQDRIVRVKWQK